MPLAHTDFGTARHAPPPATGSRLFHPGPGGGLAYAGCALAVASVAAAVLAGLGHRLEWWTFGTGFTVLKWAAYGAILALLLCIAAAVRAGPATRRSAVIAALAGLALSLAPLIAGGYWFYRAAQVPPIHDITTDMADPPRFVDVMPLRADAANPAGYGGAAVAAQQQQAYPDIHPLLLSAEPQAVFTQALTAARDMGWEIIAAVPEEGRIEAAATTFWFGFQDDIVIRIRPEADGSLLDIRSVSRVGAGDVGTNAERIRQFLARMGRRGG